MTKLEQIEKDYGCSIDELLDRLEELENEDTKQFLLLDKLEKEIKKCFISRQYQNRAVMCVSNEFIELLEVIKSGKWKRGNQ